ncbi:MAG: PSD1 and planctomycete cytochrome C domain-containing protein [Planctomycetota bacterium]
MTAQVYSNRPVSPTDDPVGCCRGSRCRVPWQFIRPLGVVIMLVALCGRSGAVGDDSAGDISFNRDILPILAENCYACHGFDHHGRQADLRLDTFDGATADRDSGPAIIAGDSDQSLIIQRIESQDPDLVMPPPETNKTISAPQKELLRRWIAAGARYDKHWSFIAPERPQPPVIENVSHPVDHFIHVKLQQFGLTPSPKADPATLMRRVSLDLTGLPPLPEEIDAFIAAWKADPNGAFGELVDRLLASPHYGERWGRWWLDQARYADSNGYSIDAPRQIWKYRDWVVESLNEDLPFDQFTVEQLAGDMLPDATERQRIATGFHRNTQINQEGGIDREQFRIDSVFDRVATTGTVWLGLTIGCAQCHNHKFDPIEQREYYQFFAFLNNQDEPSLKVYEPGVDPRKLATELKQIELQLKTIVNDRRSALESWERQLSAAAKAAMSAEVRKALGTAVEKRSLMQNVSLLMAGTETNQSPLPEFSRRHGQLSSRLNDSPTTMVLSELAQPRKTTVLIKGDFTRPAEEVFPGTPAVLHPLSKRADRADRLDLARWLTSAENPLTARVIANRVWQVYFGRGIVETDNDFGLLGTAPSHPELLDWLACELRDNGWSLKKLHRLIVTSETYQQSSHARQDVAEKDPSNVWLARQSRLRLDGELVRDVALTASGLLSRKIGGQPVYPPIPEGVMSQGQSKHAWPVSNGEDRYRRALYTFMFRATPPPALNVFDTPDGYSTCTRRNRSNTPLQSLTLMNDAAFVEFAQALEKIVRTDGVDVAFRRCTGRLPTDAERAILNRLDSLTTARALLNLDETITRE